MNIAYHLGVHCTDDDRLVRTLHRNAACLAEEGIEVPDPERYRSLIRDTAIQLNGEAATPELQTAVLDQIIEADDPDRLVLSWDNFLAFPSWAVKGTFYRTAGERMRAITRIFPEVQAEFFIGLRNPATFLPDLFRRQRESDYYLFIQGTEPESLRWSDMIQQLRLHNPDVPITVWADEDTPLIWPEVLQAVTDHSTDLALEGTSDLLATLMTARGMNRLTGLLANRPPENVAQRRDMVANFLQKFGRAEVLDFTFALPGWTESMVERMSDSYEADLDWIGTMPGVTILQP